MLLEQRSSPMIILRWSVARSSTSTCASVRWRAFAGSSEFETVGFTFLGFLMALAILEHWLLMLPFPNKIWDWGLKSRAKLRPTNIEVIAGFLGAGKTTFVRRLLA